MIDKTKYRIEKLYSKQTAIFAPNDICAMAVVDSYLGSKEKVETIVAKANQHDVLLEALTELTSAALDTIRPFYPQPHHKSLGLAVEQARSAIAMAKGVGV